MTFLFKTLHIQICFTGEINEELTNTEDGTKDLSSDAVCRNPILNIDTIKEEESSGN